MTQFGFTTKQIKLFFSKICIKKTLHEKKNKIFKRNCIKKQYKAFSDDFKDTGSSTVSAPPKYILRPINERKALNPNPILDENYGGVGSGGLNPKKLKKSKFMVSNTSTSAANLTKQQYSSPTSYIIIFIGQSNNNKLKITKPNTLIHQNQPLYYIIIKQFPILQVE